MAMARASEASSGQSGFFDHEGRNPLRVGPAGSPDGRDHFSVERAECDAVVQAMGAKLEALNFRVDHLQTENSQLRQQVITAQAQAAASAEQTTTFDPDAILAKAYAVAKEAAAEQVVASTARLDAVRRITEPVKCYAPGDAHASQVAYVKQMTQHLSDRMDAAVKAKDIATIDTLFGVAVVTVLSLRRRADSAAPSTSATPRTDRPACSASSTTAKSGLLLTRSRTRWFLD